MNSQMLKLIGIFLLLAGFASAGVAETRYTVADLGALPGDYEATPWGINAHGDVVGSSAGPKGQRAFLFVERVGMLELPTMARGGSSVARDINDLGVVVGQSNSRAAVWDLSGNLTRDVGPKFLGSFDSTSEAMAVNNLGEIAGWMAGDTVRGARHAFVYAIDRGMIDITAFGFGEANDINDAGLVVGAQNGRAFLWNNGSIKFPDLLPGFGLSAAYGINEFLDFVGSMTNKSLTSQHSFKLSAAFGPEDLGGYGDRNMLRRINNKGQSVGQGRLADNVLQALIHSDSDGLQALNDLIAAPSEWFVDFATDINDYGVIVATAWNGRSRTRHAVKLIPAPAEYCLQGCARSDEN